MLKKIYTCQDPLCKREFDEYEKSLTNSNKCIFHCDKKDWNNLFYSGDFDYEKSKEKTEYLWKEIKKFLNLIDSGEYNNSNFIFMRFYNTYTFIGFVFPFCPNYIFGQINFGLEKQIINKKVNFVNCTFLDEFSLSNLIFKDKVSFINPIIENVISIHKCEFKSSVEIESGEYINGEIRFLNSEFDDKFVVINTKIKKLSLDESYLSSLVSFDYSEFKILSLYYSKFTGYLSCIDTKIIEELDLENVLLEADIKFIRLDVKVKNRETARIIKDSFEKQNNFIEANKFYALEMKEREKELKEDIKKGKNLFEWLVFKIHGISSNHSQDWVLSLLWIINISFIVGVFNQSFFYIYDKAIFITFFILILLFIGFKFKESIRNVLLSLFLIIFYFSSGVELDFVSNLINPFSIMTKGETLTFGILVFKIIIAYLIYQLIISVRQNTRRK